MCWRLLLPPFVRKKVNQDEVSKFLLHAGKHLSDYVLSQLTESLFTYLTL
jgi:hypothetical protein